MRVRQIEKQKIEHPVFIHRMVCRIDGPGKRKADGRPRREFEYVDVQRLLARLRVEFPGNPTPARTFAAMVRAPRCARAAPARAH